LPLQPGQPGAGGLAGQARRDSLQRQGKGHGRGPGRGYHVEGRRSEPVQEGTDPWQIELAFQGLPPGLSEEQVVRFVAGEDVVEQAGAGLELTGALAGPGHALVEQAGDARDAAELTARVELAYTTLANFHEDWMEAVAQPSTIIEPYAGLPISLIRQVEKVRDAAVQAAVLLRRFVELLHGMSEARNLPPVHVEILEVLDRATDRLDQGQIRARMKTRAAKASVQKYLGELEDRRFVHRPTERSGYAIAGTGRQQLTYRQVAREKLGAN